MIRSEGGGGGVAEKAKEVEFIFEWGIVKTTDRKATQALHNYGHGSNPNI